MASQVQNQSQAQASSTQPSTQLAPRPPSPPLSVPADYEFPSAKLQRRQTQRGKTPVVLVACGSFSPMTIAHLSMFEMARNFTRVEANQFEVIGGYVSPVSDAYGKTGLAPAYHRVNMCKAAVESSDWIMVDTFETSARTEDGSKPAYVPTADSLKHFDHEINDVVGIEDVDGNKVRARIFLLAGTDLLLSFVTPNLWSPADIDLILGTYGVFVIERHGYDDPNAFSQLKPYEQNIYFVHQPFPNEISSTKVRKYVQRDLSVMYMVPDAVSAYIAKHGLYRP